MTNEQLAALEAAAKAATPGPWKHYNYKGNDCVTVSGKVFLPRNELSAADTAFIAAANPAAILNLIAELRQARRERDWLASQLEGACYSAEDAEYCSLHDCNDCKYTSAKVWLEAAKEAVK